MTGQLPNKLDASDVLNWERLTKIAVQFHGPATNLRQALAGFAYDFTSVADETIRNEMLADLLRNATEHTSRASAEEVLETLSRHLQSDLEVLRKFAKQCGVRLKP